MKLLCLVACLLASGSILSENFSVLAPPHINDIQQKKFVQWKDYFLKSLRDKKRKFLVKENEPVYLNELIYSESPYLIQHANNPVNWKPWRSDLLQKAKHENKLIFLSIGYSTCHWCHTMEKESFTDVEVASLINENYLAIKVDREELPHIDDYYASALEQVKGSAGWPITVIVNGDGLPVFIDSYLSKQKLRKLLTKVNMVWKNQPDFLLSNAKTIDLLVRERFNLNYSEGNISDIRKTYKQLDINKKLIEALDPSEGGFKGQVKFPSEPMLLYALDQLRRAPNPDLERVIKLQLDKMISGGLYDHVEGGFHRYSTDSSWTIPHFEKMLYNQAQMIEVYSQAYQYFRKPAYRNIVEHCVEFLMENFHIPGKGFASAMDADFDGLEGGYYLWTSLELQNIKELELIKHNKGLLKTYQITDRITNEILHGVILPVDPSEQDAEIVRRIRIKLIDLRKARGKPGLDNKVLTGWNALTIKSLLTAGELLNKQVYVENAKQLANLLWIKRFKKASGFLSRTGFNDSLSQRYLEDYAYFADVLISLYDITGKLSWLQKAQLLNNAAIENFLDEDGGWFNGAELNAGLSLKKSNDSELVSATAVAIDVISKLDRRLGTNLLKRGYSHVIDYMKLKVVTEPLSHLYGDFAINQFEKGSTAAERYFAMAKGNLKFSCTSYIVETCTEVEIDINLAEGWHVNSNAPLQDYLVPTKLKVGEGFSVSYPKDKRVKLGFQEEPLSVYEGQFKLVIKRAGNDITKAAFALPLQACNDNLCLLPEEFRFVM